MAIIAPVFAPSAPKTPAVEAALGAAWLKLTRTEGHHAKAPLSRGENGQGIPLPEAEIARMAAAGMNIGQVAEALGVSHHCMRKRAMALGIRFHTQRPTDGWFDAERAEQLAARGLTLSNAAMRMGMARTTFQNHCARAGIRFGRRRSA